MIDFTSVQAVTVPEGSVTQISDAAGDILWAGYDYLYVSMGDSIAAGHSINADWATDYGESSQYGKKGRMQSVIVPGCYTDLIRSALPSHASGRVKAISYARSGDTVADLMTKLTHASIVNTVKRAKLMTICIGANDILQTAMNQLDEYITIGSLANIEASVEANLAALADDSNANSYKALLDRLTELNPTATIVFTTVYNPYKYLWIEEGHHGFFEPIMDAIPDMEVAGVDFDSFIKDSLLGTPIVEQLFDRVNGLGDWVEVYVTRLNDILKQKVTAYQSTNPNIKVADTKAVFDGVPDREITAERHYNDLVSVEYTQGYDTAQMDWGRLYDEESPSDYWWGLAGRYALDIDGLAEELVDDIVNKVIVPDVDPHPESYGHYVLERSFADALGWQSLDRYTITYDANGGTGTMANQTVLGVDGLTAYASIAANTFTHETEGYHFTQWVDVNDTSRVFNPGDWVGFSGDLPLQAEWSNVYYIRYDAYSDSALLGDDDTGKMDYYALAIDGVFQDKFGKFSNPSVYIPVTYGAQIVVAANDSEKNEQSYVSWNGERVTEKSNFATYTFTLTCNLRIRFEANKYYSGITLHEYWNGYITTLP